MRRKRYGTIAAELNFVLLYEQLYGCGLNDSSQLGLEKNVTKISMGTTLSLSFSP